MSILHDRLETKKKTARFYELNNTRATPFVPELYAKTMDCAVSHRKAIESKNEIGNKDLIYFHYSLIAFSM